MSLPIYVDAYSGLKANERPRQFVLDENVYEIDAVEDQWYSSEGMFFRVRTTDGKKYILRYNEPEDEWRLQSGFDGDALLTRPGIELVTVDLNAIHEAQSRIVGCQHCCPEQSEIPFDWILAEVLDKRGRFDFVLTEIAQCPNCREAMSEKTLVEPQGGFEVEIAG